jgi:preprotein translocase subunit YajC
MKKRNVIWLTVAQFVLLIVACYLSLLVSAGSLNALHMLGNLIDIPSIILIIIFVFPGLAIAGVWRDFWKAFTVGQKVYNLKELKNMSEAVRVGQKLAVLGGILAVVFSLIAIFVYVDVRTAGVEVFVANIKVAIQPIIYVSVIEYLLIPVSVNITKTINEEMSFDEEE